jgi:glycerol uptake facilitator-like aquaporin
MPREIFAEGLGAALLAATVVGSGIMAERLADGNDAIALLANTGATVAVLATLIALFGELSGAHFNPVVTMNAWLGGRLRASRALPYMLAQVAGCCLGAMLANFMFELPAVELSTHMRSGPAQWLSEFVATFGLALIVLHSPSVSAAAWRVPLWIGAAYWFTASTSFANPAISIARSLTDTFSGIRPADVPAFAIAQIAGGLAGLLVHKLLFVNRAAAASSAGPVASPSVLRP